MPVRPPIRLFSALFPEKSVALFAIIGLAQGFAEFFQRFALLRRQIARRFYVHRYELVAPALAIQVRNPFAPQPEHCAALGTLRDAVLHLSIDGGNLHVRAQRRLHKTNRRLAENGIPFPAENLMGPHRNGDVQIARRAAVAACVSLSPQGNGLSVVNTGRNRRFGQG